MHYLKSLWDRLWRWLFPPEPEPIYEGRQQERRAVRDIASEQLAGAPVKRAVRRKASRDLAKRYQQRKKEQR